VAGVEFEPDDADLLGTLLLTEHETFIGTREVRLERVVKRVKRARGPASRRVQISAE
jgi:hypothetical protein